MVSLDEASGLMSETCHVTGIENIALMEALHRVLARDILAAENVPPFDRSPFDGYAMRAADLASASAEQPVTLSVIEEVPAGKIPERTVNPGQAAKIMTGSPIPPGADCVVKFERVSADGTHVTVPAPFQSGLNIIPAGEDIERGTVAAKKGTAIDPALIGLLASLGIAEIPVYVRPDVAILSTGDEIVSICADLPPGKIRNCNAYALGGALRAIGAVPVLLGIVRDEAEAIGSAIMEGLRDADMVITTGGVSVGDFDLVRDALQQIEADVLFWRVRAKPGSSVLAARKHGKMILCLSGSPGAAMVSFQLLAAPYIRRMSGRIRWRNEEIDVAIKEGFKKPSPRKRLVRGRLLIEEGRAVMAVTENQGNGVLSSFAGTNLLGVIPEGSGPVPPGTRIKAYVTQDVR
ncbi:MAG: molybdopterin molybdotransferase MoeA [Synergistaceae bacterium]|jgi:molybdopterin molybdotransferase|nr:molybdopterin molybdotransferase MoeA [Synergistaceae bacterium]